MEYLQVSTTFRVTAIFCLPQSASPVNQERVPWHSQERCREGHLAWFPNIPFNPSDCIILGMEVTYIISHIELEKRNKRKRNCVCFLESQSRPNLLHINSIHEVLLLNQKFVPQTLLLCDWYMKSFQIYFILGCPPFGKCI